jgi:hypothetical protein
LEQRRSLLKQSEGKNRDCGSGGCQIQKVWSIEFHKTTFFEESYWKDLVKNNQEKQNRCYTAEDNI